MLYEYVCINIRACVYFHIFLKVNMWLCIYTHTYEWKHTYNFGYAYLGIFIHWSKHVYIHVRVCVCVCVLLAPQWQLWPPGGSWEQGPKSSLSWQFNKSVRSFNDTPNVSKHWLAPLCYRGSGWRRAMWQPGHWKAALPWRSAHHFWTGEALRNGDGKLSPRWLNGQVLAAKQTKTPPTFSMGKVLLTELRRGKGRKAGRKE